MSDLRRLAPADARALLALAGTSLQARRDIAGPRQMVLLDGTEVTAESLQATAHRILVNKRRALGIAPVDLTNLIENGRDPSG